MSNDFGEKNWEAREPTSLTDSRERQDHILHSKIRHHSINQPTNNWMTNQDRQYKRREVIDRGNARRNYEMKNDAK